jgi:hypothetical protein
MHTLTAVMTACVMGLLGALMLRATPEPEPAPDGDERQSDYCWTHKEREPEEER